MTGSSIDTVRKLNIHKALRGRPERLMYVQFTSCVYGVVIFKIVFERSAWACFYVTITRIFERFQHFNFEKKFLKNANLFQKTGVPFFS